MNAIGFYCIESTSNSTNMRNLYLKPWVILFAAWAVCAAGTWMDSSFARPDTSGSDTTKNIIADDSLRISIQHYRLLPLWGPAALNSGSGPSKGPGVVCTGADTFQAFWLNRGGAETLYRRAFTIEELEVDSGDIVSNVSAETFSSTRYLMASSGQTGKWSISLHDGGSNRSVLIDNFRNQLEYYSSCTPAAKPSSCFGTGDSVLLIHTKTTHDHLYLQVATSAQSALASLEDYDDYEISPSGGGGGSSTQLYNPSVTVDSAGNMFVLYRRGIGVSTNRINYHLLDRTRTVQDYGMITQNVCDDDDVQYYYPDAKAYAYGIRKFACTYWKNNTAKLALFEFDAGYNLTETTYDLATASRFPCVTGNANYLFVAWNQEFGASDHRIMGKRFPITNGTVQIADSATIQISAAGTDISRGDTTAVIQAAMDTSGNVMVVWNTPDAAQGAVIKNTPVLYDSALYISKIESVGTGGNRAAATDSIQYTNFYNYPDTAFSSTSYYNLFIRTGASAGSMGAWTPVNNDGTITGNVDGQVPYFQYKVALYAPDTVYTPSVDSLRLTWNVKPRVPIPDSVVVNGSAQTFSTGDTITAAARRDLLRVYASVTDIDSTANLQWSLHHNGTTSNAATGQPAAGAVYSGQMTMNPYQTKQGIVPCSLYASDISGWRSEPSIFYINSMNDAPSCSVVAVTDTLSTGQKDTIIATDSIFITAQSSDTTLFTIYLSDNNDTSVALAIYKNDTLIDSVYGQSTYGYIFQNAMVATGFSRLDFRTSDPDTVTHHIVYIGANFPPVIDSVMGPLNTSRLSVPFYLDVNPNVQNQFIAKTTDLDLDEGDILTYRWRMDNVLLNSSTGTLNVTPTAMQDQVLSVVVQDLAGKTDSAYFYLQYPYIDTSLASFTAALASGITLIQNGQDKDTVSITIHNAGPSNLTIQQIYTENNDASWLNLEMADTWVNQNTDVSQIPQTVLASGGTETVRVYFNLGSLSGDGVLRDTLYIRTNDYLNPTLAFPMNVTYADLPFVAGLDFSFSARLPSAAKRTAKSYSFPPHASIRFAFSEAVDVNTLGSGIDVYSYLDSLRDRSLREISGIFSYNTGQDTILFTPEYNRTSPHFSLRPDSGMFISTDSIKIRISNNLTDLAGNRLDIHQIRRPYTMYDDTTFSVTVDSSPFVVVSAMPDSGSTAAVKAPVRIVFSRNIDPSTVDTSLENNQSILITTKYSGGELIDFASVRVESTVITVVPREAFFHDDSIHVVLAPNIYDTTGYSLDGDMDGMDGNRLNPLLLTDTYAWFFYTEPTPFYIYPNPYKPSRSVRQREIGGIVFKNLNNYSDDGSQLEISIYSLRGALLYNTSRDTDPNADLQFGEGGNTRSPQWTWDTRNLSDKELASGVYYFVIKNAGSVAHKGKLMIIR